jgi:hypothetical protein
MKGYVTSLVIAAMIAGLVFSLLSRDRPKHDAPAAALEAVTVADAGLAATAPEAGAADAAPAKPAVPLRVAALGWELVAAGAALAPPAGTDASAGFGPAMELAPEPALDGVEARLARGGADPQGADIAVLPLPAFVASFERLRALEPRAFLVVGWSRGREEVRASSGALLKAPPAGDEVKLVALGPTTTSDPSARAAGSESATLLGLFALDLLGVSPSRVHLVAPGTPEARGAAFSAVVKGASDERARGFSTADAARLVPIVAVAPKALIDTREPAVREWAKAWFEGLTRVRMDAPGVARRLAAKEALPLASGVGGAPEALALVERLGQVEPAGLDHQASLIGPLGRSAVTLDTLTQRTWQLARGGGLVSAPAPEPLPIDARVVTAIAPPPKEAAPPPPAFDGDGGVAFGPIPAGAVPIVAYRAVEGDADRVASQIAFLAGVFDRGVFRIAAKGGERAARGIAGTAREKGVAAGRLGVAAADPGILASVEVLSPP